MNVSIHGFCIELKLSDLNAGLSMIGEEATGVEAEARGVKATKAEILTHKKQEGKAQTSNGRNGNPGVGPEEGVGAKNFYPALGLSSVTVHF